MSLDRYLIEKFGTYFFVYTYTYPNTKKPNKINIKKRYLFNNKSTI